MTHGSHLYRHLCLLGFDSVDLVDGYLPTDDSSINGSYLDDLFAVRVVSAGTYPYHYRLLNGLYT